MINNINDKILIPPRRTMTLKVNEMALRGQKILINTLKGKWHSLTTDHWTSRGNHSYLAVTIHWIDDDWVLKSATLCCSHHVGEQKAEDVVRCLNEVRDLYELLPEYLMATVTDSGGSMNKAGLLLDCDHHYCIDHILELTTKLVFKMECCYELLNACRGFVGHFKSSTQANAKLINAQNLHPHPNPKFAKAVTVIQDVVTRWWSTFNMLERLIRLKSYFPLVGDVGPSDEQWIQIYDLQDILKPFRYFQQVLEGQKYVTISLVVFIVFSIRKGLQELVDNSPLESFKNKVGKDLLLDFNIRHGDGTQVISANDTRALRNRQVGIPKFTIIAAALDPRTKDLTGIPLQEIPKIWDWIRICLITEYREEHPNTAILVPPVIVVPPVVDDPGNNIFEGLQLITEPTIPLTSISIEELITNEVDKFSACPSTKLCDQKDDPLKWWKDNAFMYPHLAVLARRFLCIPATSAPSERVFSTAGLTIAKDRASMLPDNANNLVFLHDNYDFITTIK